MKKNSILILEIPCLLIALLASSAEAATDHRQLKIDASGACQASAPTYEINLVKYAKLVRNEGQSHAFIACSYYSHGEADLGTENPTKIEIAVSNAKNTADTLSCTGINGYKNGPAIPSVVKEIALKGKGSIVTLSWKSTDFGNATQFPSGLFGVVCELNPQTEIHEAHIYYEKDIGK